MPTNPPHADKQNKPESRNPAVDEYALHNGELYPAGDQTTGSPMAQVAEFVCAAVDNVGHDPRIVNFGFDGPWLRIELQP